MLKPILTMAVVSIVGLSSVACTTSQEKVAHYGVGGAALGALAGTAIAGGGSGTTAGATVGALVGTMAGVAEVQKKRNKREVYAAPNYPQLCTYRDARGVAYEAPCSQPVKHPQLCTYRDARGVTYEAPCSQPVKHPQLCTYRDEKGVLFQAPCSRSMKSH
ncbi:putative membrane protein [Bartonella australis AUST/NH1]|uniref:Putative membrane protein n=1 Tax=Bartonella australis (strain Aust/NH1) TaxID=1094489 RepID=M1PEH6_BARAA|nr:putative membrane protein [Bartonella australis AUST/NH1]